MWRGRETRPHDDIEIAIARGDLAAVLAVCPDLVPHAAGSGKVVPLTSIAELLPEFHQVWMLDPAACCWRFDILLEPSTPETYVYRRDPSITLPRADSIMTATGGIPFLAPEIVLLFKAKALRPKDQTDFGAALLRLTAKQRTWLIAALTKTHPGHPWLAALNFAP